MAPWFRTIAPATFEVEPTASFGSALPTSCSWAWKLACVPLGSRVRATRPGPLDHVLPFRLIVVPPGLRSRPWMADRYAVAQPDRQVACTGKVQARAALGTDGPATYERQRPPPLLPVSGRSSWLCRSHLHGSWRAWRRRTPSTA